MPGQTQEGVRKRQQMTNSEYKQWSVRHRRLTCAAHPSYEAMLAEWESIFAKIKATSTELHDASEWFAAQWLPDNATAVWGSHPGVLQKRILAERKRLKEREAYQDLLKNKKPLTFAAEGHRAKVLEALTGIGNPGEAKE